MAEGEKNQDRRDVARRLSSSIQADERISRLDGTPVPDRDAVISVIDLVYRVLFPGLWGGAVTAEEMPEVVEATLAVIGSILEKEVAAALRYRDDRPDDAHVVSRQIVDELLHRLPEIRRRLSLDVQEAYDGDPSIRHGDEVVLAAPGLQALAVYRVANELYRMDVPLVPRIMAEHVHGRTGVDIHPGATIGRSCFIDHGTGVVIGETTILGDHCRIYQGVTLGARSFEMDNAGVVTRGGKRHPTLEDHVTVYAGATILGGDTVIGAGSIVSGGVFLTRSVPPGHIVRGPRAEITLLDNPQQPPGSYAI